MDGTDPKSGTPLTRGRSPRVRKDCHEERRERQEWALAVVKAMNRSPSDLPGEQFGPEPPPGKATNFKPTHLPGPPDAPGLVYFAYCAGRIKIGYTSDAVNRMGSYTTHTPFPVTLLLTIGGSFEDELNYHEMFAEDRRHGEWFHLSWELREFLDEKMGDDGFTMLFEVEEDFYSAMKGSLAYITEIMEEIERYEACPSTSSVQTANNTVHSATEKKRKPLERIIGPRGHVTIAPKIPTLGS